MKTANPIGRFAPSPTGDLHFGSLLAALASYCDIKSKLGKWRLRIDDIDGPRSVPGSADSIQRTLDAFGFEWDGPIIWQSQQLDRYTAALAQLVDAHLIFSCNCSRRSLPRAQVYPGACRTNVVLPVVGKSDYRLADHALRVRLHGQAINTDAVQGIIEYDLEHDVGDVIVWRRDGLVSYSLACAIDDAHPLTHVVRGADLLESSGAQIGLMTRLGLTPPNYAHIPVVIDANGDKLCKHSRAPAITKQQSVPLLLQAWNHLGQIEFTPESLADFWKQAPALWQMQRVPQVRQIPL